MTPVKTIILDIDGTLIEHRGTLSKTTSEYKSDEKPLRSTIEKIDEWEGKGYNIVLMTGRKESSRLFTEMQLANMNIFYDQLIMGVGGGVRHLVNDKKPDGTLTAFAHNLTRNEGIGDLNL